MKGFEYQYTEGKIGDRAISLPVRLDGKRVGIIKSVKNGWQFFTMKQKENGKVFKTISEVQKRLEDERGIRGSDV